MVLATPDPRTLDACRVDASEAVAEYDGALDWLEAAAVGPMDPVAAEVWAFDLKLEHVLLARHRYRGWVPPGGTVELGETPREAAAREFAEETGLRAVLHERPVAVTVRSYRPGWRATLGLSYIAVLDGSVRPVGEGGQPAVWTPLASDWESVFPEDRPRIRAGAELLRSGALDGNGLG